MEQNFQTSFIPKKPMTEERSAPSRPIGAFMVLSILVLFTMIVASAGLYFYKSSVANSITKMETALNLAKNRFEPAKITQLQDLDRRLRASSEILSKHIAVSPIFEILGDLTLKTVRYTEFNYTSGTDQNAEILINMKGEAVGYRSIALQADLFSKENRIIDPIFSNLTLDNNGNVVFDLQFSVSADLVNYKTVLEKANSQDSPSSNINN